MMSVKTVENPLAHQDHLLHKKDVGLLSDSPTKTCEGRETYEKKTDEATGSRLLPCPVGGVCTDEQ